MIRSPRTLWQLMTYLKVFYTNLYKAETDFDEPICKQYLDKLETASDLTDG